MYFYSMPEYTSRDMCFQEWVPSAVSKQAAYHALTEYYQSQMHKENKEFGEEIARLKVGSFPVWARRYTVKFKS